MRYWTRRVHVKYEIAKKRDALIRWVVWKMPKRFVMWSYIRVASHATTGEHRNTIVPELGMMEALKRWPVQ